MRTQRIRDALALSILTLCVAGSARATTLVANGSFENVTGPVTSKQLSVGPTPQTSEDNWTTTGYAFVFTNATASAPCYISSSCSPVRFWGVNDTGPKFGFGTLGPSPDGGNFIAIDPVVKSPGTISQTISGLVVGDKYSLQFDYAGAQQYGYSGTTTDGWDVNIGSDSFTTGLASLASHTFSGWSQISFEFTATSASELLKFLSIGGPSGTQPPFSLLDGVSITHIKRTHPVPEPVTLSVLGAGLVGAAAIRRRKVRKT